MEIEPKIRAIISNLQEKSQDINEANRQLARAEAIFSARARPAAQHPPLRARIIVQGPKGGLYYVNDDNQKVYLSPGQCRSCENGTLANVAAGCPPLATGYCQPTRSELKRRLNRSERKRKTLKRKLRSQRRRRQSCKEKLKRLKTKQRK